MNTDQTEQITVGVVGLGRAGWNIHLAALHPHPRYKVTSVVDPDPERRAEAEKEFGVTAFAALDELLGDDKPDIVVVASPSKFHYSEAKTVLEADCHCVLEKPMAADAREARKLIELAERQGKSLLVHHQQVFSPLVAQLREVMERGVLGPIFNIRVFSSVYARRWDWQTLRKNGGGQLPNKCSHILSIVLPLLDEFPEVVASDLRNIKDAGDAEDHVELFLRTPSGLTVDLVVSSAIAFPGPEWMLLGKNGSMISDGKVSRIRYYDPKAVPDLEVIDSAAPGRMYQREELPWQTEEMPVVDNPGAERFYDNVANVILTGAQPRFSLTNALNLMLVIDQARERSPD